MITKRMSRLTVALAITTPVTLAAAELEIQVRQLGTGDPVEGATVVLAPSSDYRTTDSAGRVHFDDVQQSNEIKILAPGHEALVTSITADHGTQTIYVEPLRLEGDALEVVADRLPDKVSKISLSAEELGNVPGTQGDPLTAIRTLPGVVATGEGSNQVYLRGSDAHESLTLVNRLPIGYLYHFGGFRSTIAPSLISDLNVFLGGFPVTHGDALGGVIDIGIRPPRQDRRHTNFNISTIEASALVEGPVGNAAADSYLFAGRRSYIDLLLSPSDLNDWADGDKPAEETNQIIQVPRFYDLQGIYHRNLSRGTLDFFYFGAQDEMRADIREGKQSDPQGAGELYNQHHFDTLGIDWRHNISDQISFDLPVALYATTEKLRMGTDANGEPFFADTTQDNIVARPQVIQQTAYFGELRYGLDLSLYHVPLDLYISAPPSENDKDFNLTDKPKFRVSDTINARALAPYFQQRKQWSSKWTSTLGLRYTDVSGDGGIDVSETSPRATVEYQFTGDTLLTATWGRYVQVPLGYELVEGFGNPHLGVSVAEHRILGVQQRLNNLWYLTLEAYHKPMEKLVVPTADPQPPNNYANEGDGESYGLDVMLKRARSNGRQGWISYAYSKSTRYSPYEPADGQRDFSGDTPQALSAVWSQPFTDFDWLAGWKRWTWGITLQLHSGAPYTPLASVSTEMVVVGGVPVTRYKPVWGQHNSQRFSPYFRLDTRIERELLKKQSTVKVYLEVLNLTNQKNVVDLDYGERYENIGHPDEVTGLPIFPYLGVEVDL